MEVERKRVLNGLETRCGGIMLRMTQKYEAVHCWPIAKPGNYLSLNLCAALEFVRASMQRARYTYRGHRGAQIGIVHT